MSALPRQPYADDPPAASEIPYGSHVSPSVVSTRDGDFLSVWQIAGRHVHGRSADERLAWGEELNDLLRSICTAHVSLWYHAERVESAVDIPEAGNAFVRALSRHHGENLRAAGLFVNRHFLTVVYRPEADNVLSFFGRREKLSIADRLARQAAAIDALDTINAQIAGRMEAYGARLLTVSEGENGCLYSDAMRPLARIFNGVDEPVPILRAPLAEYFASADAFTPVYGEVGEIRQPDGQQLFGMVEIQEYRRAHSRPGDLDAVLSLPFPVVVTQSFAAMNRTDAATSLRRHQTKLEDSQDADEDGLREIAEAMGDAQAGRLVMGKSHLTIRVVGATAEEVRRRRARAANALLEGTGVKPHVVGRALTAAMWAQLPAKWEARPRPADISSRTFLSFAAFYTTAFGKPVGNQWGEAVAVLRAPDGTPVYFSFHPSGDAGGERVAGHTLLTGQTGSGKTVTLGFLLAQSMRFGVTAFALDVDEGLKPTVLALGGRYWTVRIGGGGFRRNPLAGAVTPQKIEYVKQFVRTLCEATGERVTHGDAVQISRAVESAMRSDARRLSLVLQSLPRAVSDDDDRRPSVYERLLPWCEGGEYGWAFDHDADDFDLAGCPVFGLDLTAALDHPVLCAPVVMDALHLAHSLNDGRPLLHLIDEGWRALKNAQLAAAVQSGQKTGRKRNLAVVFSTQEPGEALRGEVGESIAQAAASFICLPNPGGTYDDYRRILTASEFDVLQSLPLHSRKMIVKQGGVSVTALLDLSGADALAVLSGSPDRAALLDRIMEQHGRDPDVSIPIYVQAVRGGRGGPVFHVKQ